MWTREQLKFNAKAELRQYYWLAFAATAIYSIVSGIVGTITSSLSGLLDFSMSYNYNSYSYGYYSSTALSLMGIFMGLVITIVVAVFILNPLIVGVKYFFIRCAYGDRNIANLLFPIQSGKYWNIVKVMFFQSLYVTLYSLLFIVPGIIKVYEYYMVPYILAENPDMDYRSALELSKQMTYGEKMNIFTLELSFIGWIFLGFMCCVGILFVYPYTEATYAQLYFALKAKMGGQFTSPHNQMNQPPVSPQGYGSNPQFYQAPVYSNQPPIPPQQGYGYPQTSPFGNEEQFNPNQPANPYQTPNPTSFEHNDPPVPPTF